MPFDPHLGPGITTAAGAAVTVNDADGGGGTFWPLTDSVTKLLGLGGPARAAAGTEMGTAAIDRMATFARFSGADGTDTADDVTSPEVGLEAWRRRCTANPNDGGATTPPVPIADVAGVRPFRTGGVATASETEPEQCRVERAPITSSRVSVAADEAGAAGAPTDMGGRASIGGDWMPVAEASIN